MLVERYVNYGTLGFVAGHEIIHAFDDRGITIDEFGVDFEKDQWSNATRQEFNRRMQSLIDFYAKTFQSYRHEQGPTKARVLPGFEKYTNDQLYFLSFASIWCNNNKYDPNSIYSNNHASTAPVAKGGRKANKAYANKDGKYNTEGCREHVSVDKKGFTVTSR
nr:neprilysin-1-like [Rhipicephalus microplus]